MPAANPRDSQFTTQLTRRDVILAGATAAPLLGAAIQQVNAAESAVEAVGPILGHVDHETAMIWYRPKTPGEYLAKLTHAKTGKTRSAKAVASPDHDLCVTWRFDGLEAGSEYTYVISHQGRAVAKADIQRIRTAPRVDQPT